MEVLIFAWLLFGVAGAAAGAKCPTGLAGVAPLIGLALLFATLMLAFTVFSYTLLFAGFATACFLAGIGVGRLVYLTLKS